MYVCMYECMFVCMHVCVQVSLSLSLSLCLSVCLSLSPCAYGEEDDGGRLHRVLWRENDAPVIQPARVHRLAGAADSKVPLKDVVLPRTRASIHTTHTGLQTRTARRRTSRGAVTNSSLGSSCRSWYSRRMRFTPGLRVLYATAAGGGEAIVADVC
jgi:hypothetical protein